MAKWIGGILFALFLGLCALAYLYSNALRDAGMAQAKTTLKMSLREYQNQGYVTNYGSTSYDVWLSTNHVNIEGTQYQCFVTTRNAKFNNEGLLAMTTNEVFIWLDAKRPPKIIGAHYKAPLFPPRF
jgi:hypothetical protein